MKKVFICAGHGGRYTGAVSANGKYIEKDNNLAIARAIHGREINVPGVVFTYARLKDIHFSNNLMDDLIHRCHMANQSGADIFIAIHQNADIHQKGYGAETFSLAEVGEGRKIATAVQKKMVVNTDLYDRGIKTANFVVLRETAMPAILVEAGFVGGDPEEARYVSQQGTISKIAEGILMGLCDYLGVEYGYKPKWSPQQEVDRLVEDGVINTPRDHKQQVSWGEFATVLNRARDGRIILC